MTFSLPRPFRHVVTQILAKCSVGSSANTQFFYGQLVSEKNKNISYFVIQYFCCFSQNLWCIVRWTCTTWPCFHKQAIGGLSLSIYIPLRLLIDIFSGRASTIMRRRDVNCVLRRSIPVWRSGRLAFFFCTAQNTQTTRLYDKEKIYRFLIV